MEVLFPLILLAAFWLLLIRPQQRRVREHQRLVSSIEVGDEIVTTAGVYGYVRRLGDDVVELEVASGVVIRLARGAIGTRVEPPEPLEPPELPGPVEDA